MATGHIKKRVVRQADSAAAEPMEGKFYRRTRRADFDGEPGRCGSKGWIFSETAERKAYATFWTLPERMHDVQTLSRRPAPFTRARTGCKFKFQRRFVTLCA